LGGPAGADVHHRTIGLAAHLQEVGISGPGTALHIEHLSQVGLLTGRLYRDHITDLHLKKIRPHRLRAESFKLVRLYCFDSGQSAVAPAINNAVAMVSESSWLHRLAQCVPLAVDASDYRGRLLMTLKRQHIPDAVDGHLTRF